MNYYIKFCWKVPGTEEQHDQLEEMLCFIDDDTEDDVELSEDVLDAVRKLRADWGDESASAHVVREGKDAYVEDDAGEGSYGLVAKVIHLWMKLNDLPDMLVYQAANTASKHTTDAFGGAVVWISKDDAFCIDTSDLARIDMNSSILGDIVNY